MIKNRGYVADLVLTDDYDNIIVVVEVKTVTNEATRKAGYEQLKSYLIAKGAARYAMLVDKEQIILWRVESRDPLRLVQVTSLSTQDCLEPYLEDSDSGLDMARKFLMEGLVGAWLEDLFYHWRYSEPAGYEELEKVGFIQDIKGSVVVRQGYRV